MDWELIITGLIYGLTFLVGIVGNLLIIYSVIHFKPMKSLSNIFLANLATADLILIIFCIPVKFAQLFSHTWTFGEFLCKTVYYIQNLSAICSVYTLTGMSIERYYAIMYPMQCRYICTISQTKKTICITWLASIFLALPIVWIQILLEVGDEQQRAYWCIRNWNNTLAWKIYEIYMLSVILLIPSVIMTFSYARICLKLGSIMSQRTSEFPMDLNRVYINASANRMSQVIKMLIVVVVVFVICWAPILLTNLITAFALIPALNYGSLKYLRTSFNLLSYLNSCLNPMIYGFMSKSFRDSFRAALEGVLGACGSSRAR